ncbi:MATE family efflux transporter [Salinarchaeum laminariae]|uniref:MATE family efflux transporter n=1 Tax=Salinarchaeum laminariae TaxID=869888 RepID=UPI0020BF4571|nr:MATE family efflux transporter [Salinarchaeum laminariae]
MAVPNPLRWLLLAVGRWLSDLELVDRERIERTTDLAWPRILTGIARMSKSVADVAMVGLAIGPAAIAGVGFGGAFWGLAFALGGGVAGGTISLVSQRYGAEAYDELSTVVTCSAVAALLITIPIGILFAAIPETLIELVGSGSSEASIEYGADYIRVLAVGVPLAGLNLIGSRALVGADDAWTPMLVRGGGAIVNIGLNATFIFGLGMGVTGAALGTVLANVLVAGTFAAGMLRGSLPWIGEFPVTVSLRSAPIFDRDILRDLVRIASPLVVSNTAGNVARFPLLFLVGQFGETTVAAYVIGRQVRNLLNTPGWGFSLASSSLVGQELGSGDENEAGLYGRDILRLAVATYVIGAALAVIFARPIAMGFVNEASTLPLATKFVRVAALSVVFWGVSGAATGPLRASGDTRWPFYANLLGRYGFAIPLAALGAWTPLALWGIYASILAETIVPAAVNYHRFATGEWKAISREFRPEAAPSDD